MSTRGSQFTRTMRYFRESDIDEAQAALARAAQIVNGRIPTVVAPKIRKARKPKHAATEVAAGAAAVSGGQ
jgi:hypothetical protein